MNTRERVYVVDENDEVIGEKWRDELTNNDCWRVVSVWVTNAASKILLQQRSLQKKIGPGIWTAACEGTIERGDSPEETAIRELQEEIGITVEVSDLIATIKVRYQDPFFGWRVKYGYKLTMDLDEKAVLTLQQEEVAQTAWLTKDELEQLRTTKPSDFPLYNQYQQLGFIN